MTALTAVTEERHTGGGTDGAWTTWWRWPLAFAFCLLAPWALLTRLGEAEGSGDHGWSLAVMVVAGWCLAGILASGRPVLYATVAWAFTYIFMGAIPVAQILSNQFPTTTPRIAEYMVGPAGQAVAVGVAAMALGMGLSRGRAARSLLTREVAGGRTFALVALTYAFVAYSLSKTGVAPLFESRDALLFARNSAWRDTATVAVMTGASLALPLVSVHALVRLRDQQRARGDRARHGIALTAMTLTLLVTINPISSPRITFGTALLSLAVAFGAFRTKNRTRLMVASIVVGLVVVFPAADAFRRDQAQVTAIDVQSLVTKGDYDAFAQMTNTMLYVDRYGDTDWRQAAGVVTFWVPRSLWPDKPTDTGAYLARFRGYEFRNLSEPLWGEGYINGGWIGLAVVMGGFGYLAGRGDRRILRSARAGRAPGILDAILPFYSVIILRGSLLQATAGLAVLAVTAWAVTRPTSATGR